MRGIEATLASDCGHTIAAPGVEYPLPVTRLVRTTFECPNCRNEFESAALASSSHGAVTTEFRPVALGMPPEPYEVHTCPKCGLSGWDEVFEDDTIAPRTSKLIADRVTPLVRGGSVPAWRRYEYAAWIAEWQDKPDDTVAYLFLCAAWCCDDSEEDPTGDLATGYRQQAITFNQRALLDDRLEGNRRAEVTYLIGELYRRIGGLESADQWLRRVGELVASDETGRRIAALADRQRTAPEDQV